jgi:hypothetical protein
MTSLLVGTDDGLHHLIGLGERGAVELPGRVVDALASDADVWWALTDGRQLWRGAASGNWEPVGELRGLRANCLCASPNQVLVGTSEAHLARLETHQPIGSPTDSRLAPVQAFDRTVGRDDWYTPWGGPPDVRSISRGADGSMYANVHVGGIVRSTDGGETWHPTIDIHSDVHEVLAPAGHPGVVLAACARGLARSADGGDTWEIEAEGLHSTYSRAVAAGDESVYLSASLGPRGGRACLYRRPLVGRSFEKCSEGLPEWFAGNIDTFCVAASGSEVAFGTEDGSVFVSTDTGRRWETWAENLPPVRCLALL